MSTKQLKKKHNYKVFADTCKNCKHFKNATAYENIPDIFADSCHVDATIDEDVHILHNPWGVCDEHERVGVKI